jgi:hypothetical protein
VEKAIAGDWVRRSRCRVTVLRISLAGDAWAATTWPGSAETTRGAGALRLADLAEGRNRGTARLSMPARCRLRAR